MQGVTVIICCYNSTSRLGPTLNALARQCFRFPLAWEVLLVDNGSTDHTVSFARDLWDSFGTTIPMHILSEPNPGQMNARKKGIGAANYSILVFCDDDNWLSPDYIQLVFDLLTGNPEIAACGGRGIPVFETAPPHWFGEFAEAYATGPQDAGSENGRILSLYGAGLAVRKRVLDELFRPGFEMLTGGRTGNSLGSADDIELTYSIVLKGYRLIYVEELTFHHYLPKERLTEEYLLRLFSSFGKDGPLRNLYYAHITERSSHRRISNWYYHLLLSLVRTGKYLAVPPKRSARKLYFRWNINYLGQLFAMKRNYGDMLNHIGLLKGTIPARKADQTIKRYEKILH